MLDWAAATLAAHCVKVWYMVTDEFQGHAGSPSGTGVAFMDLGNQPVRELVSSVGPDSLETTMSQASPVATVTLTSVSQECLGPTVTLTAMSWVCPGPAMTQTTVS